MIYVGTLRFAKGRGAEAVVYLALLRGCPAGACDVRFTRLTSQSESANGAEWFFL